MFTIGIAGGTGSGKTTVVKKILERIPRDRVALVPQDSYYKDSSHLPMEERQLINFDHPDSLEWDLLVKHIRLLKKGKPVEQPIYSYLTCSRAKETIPVEPKEVIILEGDRYQGFCGCRLGRPSGKGNPAGYDGAGP